MKLWTKSSIQTCQARLFRGTGAFRFDSAGLGEGLVSGVGVGEASTALGDGEGMITGTDVDDGCAEICGTGVGLATTSVFFCERNAQSMMRTPAARTAAPIANGFQFGLDFCSAAGSLSFILTSLGPACGVSGG